MSGASSVGQSGVYEDGDQKNYKNSEIPAGDRFHDGQPNSHKANDSKDERSIANKLGRESKREHEAEPEKSVETAQSKQDSTKPAVMHSNEPSKGAKIDQELREEEQEAMKKKGTFGSKQ